MAGKQTLFLRIAYMAASDTHPKPVDDCRGASPPLSRDHFFSVCFI